MSTLLKTARKKNKKSRLPSNSKNATVNRAGGVAFDLVDTPALKLITMTGGSFYAEPKFYGGNLRRVPNHKLASRISVVNNKLGNFADCAELDDVAREVLATAVDVANSDRPEDLLAIANWLRNDMNIRLTPQVLLVIASRIDATKPFVRKYAKSIVMRPDEIKTCLLLHRFFFGQKSLSNSLAWGLHDCLGKFGEYGFLKYNTSDFPTWKDVLCWLPSKKNNKVISSELRYFLISGEIEDADKTPICNARRKLAKLTKFNKKAKKLAVESRATWEVLVSQFGSDAENKKEVWTHLVENNLLGYMATLRNLRNLLEADVDMSVIAKVAGKLSNANEVANSKQLPFRFLSAKKVLEGSSYGLNTRKVNKLLSAVDKAIDLSVANLPKLDGLTVVFADNSGSMSTPVSRQSTVSCADAANTLCGIVAKASDEAVVCAFGTDIAEVRYSDSDSVLSVASKVARADTRGMATHAYKIGDWLKRNNLKPDRVILLSDMQCWTTNGYWGGGNNRNQNLADAWSNFRRYSKNTWLHTVHLNGYGDSPVDEQKLVNQVSGFSEKIIGMMVDTESRKDEQVDAGGSLTVDQVRENWYLS
jgi:hypothetical protein